MRLHRTSTRVVLPEPTGPPAPTRNGDAADKDGGARDKSFIFFPSDNCGGGFHRIHRETFKIERCSLTPTPLQVGEGLDGAFASECPTFFPLAFLIRDGCGADHQER